MCNKKYNIKNSNSLFVIWGLTMHLIILWGILDVNFHSPITQGLPNVPILKNAPAKRLVLFIADGLRFRTFIEEPPKFLKQVMVNKGAWGISHTRMPTESRPGVVAICAGLYEDPSAIFKGWKENPVDFDSVFNQSHFTWAWGSPDIIPMFTKADHGMTDWGSHGSGSTDETETPLIAWGAGINAFNSYQNVEQVDITPLISSLIGAPIPINNEGVLPWQYINPSNLNYINRALLNNLKQLTYQVKANRMLNCKDNEFADWREVELENKIFSIDRYLEIRDSNETLTDLVDTIKLAKNALLYFRQYQRIRFLVYLSIMWFGWITLLFFKIAGAKKSVINSITLLITDIVFAVLLFIILITHKVSGCVNWRLPWYAFLALISVWLAVRNAMTHSIKIEVHNNKRYWSMGIEIILLLATMFVGLTYRSILSVGILCIGFSHKILVKNQQKLFLWTALCLAIFPVLPVVEPYPRVYIVLLSICIAAAIIVVKIKSKHKKTIELLRLTITGLIYLEFIDGRNWISWAILLTTPLCICTYPTQLIERIQGVMLGLICPLILLSASYEPLFFIIFTLHLSCWSSDSSSIGNDQSIKSLLTIEELLKAAIFMLYTLLCFFGTGNMASISSFDPSWTRHFVTVFSPFIMFSLILMKICIPLIMVGCTSYTFGSSNSFLAVVLLGDCLALPLMYCVTPQGSWLDIGSAISRFTITISLPCLLLLLYCLSYPLITVHPNKFKFYTSLQKKHIV
ncbi:GPI ethanolamine phosphate transferase 1 isoform X2 [Megachile rotundata]|uniref:GPI ethanolamine phosphate transferase 1 isoform X2 n=1 Tax=Megachile rotundata TaxID=143995 RepID=UPI003FD632AE